MAGLEPATLTLLQQRGFHTLPLLRLLSPADIPRLTPSGSLSLAQELALKALLASLDVTPGASGSQGNSGNPVQADSRGYSVPTEAASASLLRDLLAGNPGEHAPPAQDPPRQAEPSGLPASTLAAGTQSPPSPPNQDTLLYLQGNRGEVKYPDIVDFVPGLIMPSANQGVMLGENAELLLKMGDKKPKLENVNPFQWSAANCRILYQLISSGKISDLPGVLDYLGYTVKISELACRYQWQSVLLYDRQYRYLQTALGFPWGKDTPHLSSVNLREKHDQLAQKQASGRSRAKMFDIQSGKEICISWNGGKCRFGTGCKYAHVCAMPSCGKPHQKINHPKNPQ